MSGPTRVVLTDHARLRAAQRRIAVDAIEAAIVGAYDQRRVNQGSADWRVEHRGIVVLYDWPGGGDVATAVVRSAWRQ